MVNDAILLKLSPDKFVIIVEDALKLHGQFRKDGNLAPLVESELAKSSLVKACLLTGEPDTTEARGRGVQGILHWAVNKLAPGGAHSFIERQWRFYNSLFYPYLAEGEWTFERLAEKMALSEGVVFTARNQALQLIATSLAQELREPREVGNRKQYVIEHRYRALTPAEQQILHLAVIFRQPLSLHVFQALAEEAMAVGPAIEIPRLLESGFIQRLPNDQIVVHLEARNHLLACILLRERLRLHTIAAEYCKKECNFLEAAYHWREASAFDKAAHILIDGYQAIIAEGRTEALQTLLAEFHAHSLETTTWVQLKIVAGDVARLVDNLDVAIDEYGVVLSADEATALQKALAYYRRARAFELRGLLDEALLHYKYGIQLLEEEVADEALLVDMYIDRAWIYIQERPNAERSEADLSRAQAHMPSDDDKRRARLHTAWAKLSWLQKEPEQELKHNLEAWLAATQTKDNDLIVMTGHNLGHAYVWAKEYQKGIYYLERTSKLAIQIGDQQHVAKCHKLMGACYFFQDQLDAAIEHYHQAHKIFDELRNMNWLGDVCYDLAEAYAKSRRMASGREWYQQAIALAEEANDQNLRDDLTHLVGQYRELGTQLESHQQLILDYVNKHGEITNKGYVELMKAQGQKVGRSTAGRHLNELVEMELLEAVGQGRGVHYILAT